MLDFGAQGGDPSRGVDMDLSTCVNRYGPAPAAIVALRAIEPADILLHPYDAAPRLIDLYREATGVTHGAMITGRGASEFIWAMGRELDHASVQVPNIVVLRSTTKFYGIAATRTGVAWCAESGSLTRLFGQQENWGLSGVDVRVACAAVRSYAWTYQTRAQMLDDSAWLAETLSGVPGLDLYANQNVHFQYAYCDRAHQVAEVFRRHGIGVRVLGAAHGVYPDALRIVAPRHDERERFAAAMTEVLDERVVAA